MIMIIVNMRIYTYIYYKQIKNLIHSDVRFVGIYYVEYCSWIIVPQFNIEDFTDNEEFELHISVV